MTIYFWRSHCVLIWMQRSQNNCPIHCSMHHAAVFVLYYNFIYCESLVKALCLDARMSVETCRRFVVNSFIVFVEPCLGQAYLWLLKSARQRSVSSDAFSLSHTHKHSLSLSLSLSLSQQQLFSILFLRAIQKQFRTSVLRVLHRLRSLQLSRELAAPRLTFIPRLDFF